MNNSGYAKVTVAAKFAGVSVKTIRKWLKMGLPFHQPPIGGVLIAYRDLDDWLGQYRTTKETDLDELLRAVT